ncbi:MAG: hypothetical protein HQL74_15520 [Magnetococcales bacterium]|nr:hypothetical protein [Magnetococcales bacterium]
MCASSTELQRNWGPWSGSIRPSRLKEVYWRLYDNPGHCRQSLEAYHEVYNTIRPHWALRPEGGGDPVTPADVYAGGVSITIPKWQHWAKAAKKKLQEMMEADADKALAA